MLLNLIDSSAEFHLIVGNLQGEHLYGVTLINCQFRQELTHKIIVNLNVLEVNLRKEN
jgi:hypothetical protein